MALEFYCPKCQSRIIVQYLRVGEVAKCKQCGADVVVPEDAAFKESLERQEEPVLSYSESLNQSTLGSALPGTMLIAAGLFLLNPPFFVCFPIDVETSLITLILGGMAFYSVKSRRIVKIVLWFVLCLIIIRYMAQLPFRLIQVAGALLVAVTQVVLYVRKEPEVSSDAHE